MSNLPNPGSNEAVQQGCLCPVLDNRHGDDELGRTRGFWINGGCPVHADNPYDNEVDPGMLRDEDDPRTLVGGEDCD